MQDAFIRELRYAYNHLYELAVLRKSPFVRILGLENKEDPSRSLAKVLTDAIEAIKPGGGNNPKLKIGRLYQLLYVRYIEQLTQYEAAADLGLSLRHLRREETLALIEVGTYLWEQYDLEKKWPDPISPIQKPEEIQFADTQMPDRHAELEWLQKSIPNESIKIQDLIREVLNLVDATLRAQKIQVEFNLSDNLPPVVVQKTTIRQALLGVVDKAIHTVPGGVVEINAEVGLSELAICVEGFGLSNGTYVHPAIEDRETVLRQLVELSGGALSIGAGGKNGAQFEAWLSLPVKDMVKVMVVDDNRDTLQFIERCLTGTRYLFNPVNDPEKAVDKADANPPQVIFLDVMLPKIDGWELLETFKHHPRLNHIPIIVFSILPQDQLAKDLGAMAFIQKPLSRKDLLGFLDQNADRFLKRSS
jgi:CheY-like chemotaxis protein